MEWSLVYVAFLVYIFVVVTYRVHIGDVAMATALIGLTLQKRVQFPPLLGWLGAFLFWGAIGFTQTAYPEAVWDSLIVLGKVWLISLVAFNALRSLSQIRFFMIFFLACFALYPARGAIFNYVFAGYTLVGRAIWNYIYENPNDLAALTFLPLSLASALLVADTNRWIKRGAFASVLVLPMLVLMTQSRGGALALMVYGALALLGRRRRLRGVMLVALLGTTAVMFAPSSVWQRFKHTSTEGPNSQNSSDDIAMRMSESSSRQRWAILKVAATIAADHPVVGTGFGAYSLTHAEYAPEMGPKSAHNTYLSVLAETGYPGLFIFIGLLVATFREAERTRKSCKGRLPRLSVTLWYLEVGLLAYLMAGIFGSFARLVFLYIHITLIWAVADLAVRELRRVGSTRTGFGSTSAA